MLWDLFSGSSLSHASAVELCYFFKYLSLNSCDLDDASLIVCHFTWWKLRMWEKNQPIFTFIIKALFYSAGFQKKENENKWPHISKLVVKENLFIKKVKLVWGCFILTFFEGFWSLGRCLCSGFNSFDFVSWHALELKRPNSTVKVWRFIKVCTPWCPDFSRACCVCLGQPLMAPGTALFVI